MRTEERIKEMEKEIEILTNIRLERRKKGESGQTLSNHALETLEEKRLEGYKLAMEDLNA